MKEFYLDPQVSGVNRLPANARSFGNCPAVSLNGEWLFRLAACPEACGDFFAEDCSESEYSPITVPGNWQTQGFGKPIYTNYIYPWPLDEENGVDGMAAPWRVPKDNPTGLYRKTFTLDRVEEGRRYVLRFEGVETSFELYVNGGFVGYSEDSKLAAEFDVTPWLKAGKNLITVRVFTYATSSYLEDQDYWYLCGLFRPVTLYAVPVSGIEDYKLEAVPDRYLPCARFTVDVRVARVPGFADRKVRVTLLDPDGKIVGQKTEPVNAVAEYSMYNKPTANTARISMELDAVRKWYPETPFLYTARIELIEKDGCLIDAETCRVGFKRVDIENGILLVNGQRVQIFGVNRHEHAWKFGRAVPKEHMIREIESMKKMNINAVRTCHYPDSHTWYDLCDEMGLLVLCECDLETHGVYGQISHDSAYANLYVERAQRMVMQHKNHACIYGWSLGNESGFGPGHAAMHALVKEYDKTRLCQYEAGNPGENISDTWGQMYATEKEIMQKLTSPEDTRPVILVEYLYQIRNSGGGMRKFVELLRRYPRFQGGFIWDWQDKALLGKTENGAEYFAHGGDLGEGFTEPIEPMYMTNNGLVRADLEWKPVAWDVREAYAPILIERPLTDNAWKPYAPEGLFTVMNRTLCLSSRAYALTVSLTDQNGTILRTFEKELPDIAPGMSAELDLREELAEAEGSRIFMTFIVRFAATGEEVARRQFMCRDGICGDRLKYVGLKPQVIRDGGITVWGEGFSIVFDETTGMLTEYKKNGKTLVKGSKISLNRPYCGLDAQKGWGWRELLDEGRNTEYAFESPRVLSGDGQVMVTAAFVGSRIWGQVRWMADGQGRLDIEMDVQTAEGLRLPRAGVEFTLSGDLDKVAYTGYGPYENYSDRMLSPVFGAYETDVDHLGFDFAPPSENGGREGVTKLRFASADAALSVKSTRGFHFDAHHYTPEDIADAMHTHEVPHREEITAHLDAWHAPIGGDAAWSTMMDPAEAPHAGLHTLRVTME